MGVESIWCRFRGWLRCLQVRANIFLKYAQSQYGYIFEEGQARPESLRGLIKTLEIQSFSSYSQGKIGNREWR